MEPTTTAQLTRQTEVERNIFARRAVRTYKTDPVERALIERVLDAGRMAPSAMNRQPWHFYILTDRETVQLFSRQIGAKVFKETLHSGAAGLVKGAKEIAGLLHLSHGIDLHAIQDPVFHGAPVVIFITAPRDNEWAPLDIGMCAQNIMLSAQSLGLSSCPVGFGKYVENTPAYDRMLIPPSEQVQLSIILGYSDEAPEPHPRRQDNISFID